MKACPEGSVMGESGRCIKIGGEAYLKMMHKSKSITRSRRRSRTRRTRTRTRTRRSRRTRSRTRTRAVKLTKKQMSIMNLLPTVPTTPVNLPIFLPSPPKHKAFYSDDTLKKLKAYIFKQEEMQRKAEAEVKLLALYSKLTKYDKDFIKNLTFKR